VRLFGERTYLDYFSVFQNSLEGHFTLFATINYCKRLEKTISYESSASRDLNS